MPLTNGGPHRRVLWPRGGGSTFTTGGPMSPGSIVQNGPERMRERSRTNRSSRGVTYRLNHVAPPKPTWRPSGRLDVHPCDHLAPFEMVDGLLHLPESRERIDDRVDTEVGFAAIAPRRDVVRGHGRREDAAQRVKCALHRLVFAALAERTNHEHPSRDSPAFARRAPAWQAHCRVLQLECRGRVL